ncbi:hypothetical protein A464_451 [Salmonella bongori N268-08]|uniref:Lipoprotein n=1 Tax=Salmonella bongori N268-08 TaxID=1197719 RepID=S5NBG2_SALBN|nr:hypothetical protein A464_451 [Salmonella bongori N268-08]
MSRHGLAAFLFSGCAHKSHQFSIRHANNQAIAGLVSGLMS